MRFLMPHNLRRKPMLGYNAQKRTAQLGETARVIAAIGLSCFCVTTCTELLAVTPEIPIRKPEVSSNAPIIATWAGQLTTTNSVSAIISIWSGGGANAADGGEVIYSEEALLAPDSDGNASHRLGTGRRTVQGRLPSVAAVAQAEQAARPLFIQVELLDGVGAPVAVLPRQRLVFSQAAQVAIDSQRLGGLPPEAYLRANDPRTTSIPDGPGRFAVGSGGPTSLIVATNPGNDATAEYSVVVGGQANLSSGRYATIVGGLSNLVVGVNGSIISGYLNKVFGLDSFIGAGAENQISNGANRAGIVAGQNNVVGGSLSFVGAGSGNRALAATSVVGGGTNNTIAADPVRNATIGGGRGNIITAGEAYSDGGGAVTIPERGTIAGGSDNIVAGALGTVAGGGTNRAAYLAFIGGGSQNMAHAAESTIGGGANNRTGASTIGTTSLNKRYQFIGGGIYNIATGLASAVLGGVANEATGDYSVAIGNRAKAKHNGAVVVTAGNPNDKGISYIESNSVNQYKVWAGDSIQLLGSNVYVEKNLQAEELTVRGDAEVFGQFETKGVMYAQGQIIANSSIVASQHIQAAEVRITGGSDISERFTSVLPNACAPGSVVIADPGNAGKILPSGHARDPKVIGVVSGAGGVNTGMTLGQDGHEHATGNIPVALMGRVYVKCSNENGPVTVGNQLVSSNTPGHAMKADATPASGTVIGKALSNLDKDTGLVLVLVNLQ
jgi:hypothetical protein